MDVVEPDIIHHSLMQQHQQPFQPNEDDFGSHLIRLQVTNQIKELQTVIRERPSEKGILIKTINSLKLNKYQNFLTKLLFNSVLLLYAPMGLKELYSNTTRSDFKFYADRLIRLVVEEGLNQLPYQPEVVTTPTGCEYEGLHYEEGNCGVSIMRSGEAMEQGLRDCCRSMRIGKILIMSEEDTREAKVFYAKFPPDVHLRKILLMYPILCTGNSVMKAMEILQQHSVNADKVIVLTLFATPNGIHSVLDRYPQIKILTSEVHESVPLHFGQKYFGTD